MITAIQGFELKTREAIDNRLVLSKVEMLNVNDNHMPEKYFAVCKDDGYLYIYNKNSALITSETGKFKKYFANSVLMPCSIFDHFIKK